MRPAILVVVGVVSIARAGFAQSPVTSFAALRGRVTIGESMLVTNTQGETIEGRLEAVSDAVLVLRSNGGERTFTTDDVRRVARRERAGRIGAMAGLVAGVAGGTIWALNQPCEFTCFSSGGGVLLFGAIGGGIGLAGGAVVGSLFRREHVLFERATGDGSSAAVTVKLPATAKGVLVQIDW